ncbi:hypothetical protein DFR70_104459 [Nocardia tenerifensis]|uniref:Uncharacterized protein n=1 Tax=Nocardia tenerifensis TaxID=228006 RepID=A0A318K836_9NOCA|nr:DUF6572 domain-containing protein [Nocardia tenerifensis]PXX65395.1 hypothetical protein DFR70_104459 [Nocardia tenerifensis]
MAIIEYGSIDQLALSADGRLSLAMIEDRPYKDEDTAVLIEDFIRKFNFYLHAIRSGYVQRLADADGLETGGIEIVLFSETRPPEAITDFLSSVSRNMADQGIGAHWESLASDEIGLAMIERAIADEILAALPAGWRSAAWEVVLVGGRGVGSIRVDSADGSILNIRPSRTLQLLLLKHKKASYDTLAGAWLSGQICLTAPDRHRAQFSKSVIPDWAMPIDAQKLEDELAAYPRVDSNIPVWIRNCSNELDP